MENKTEQERHEYKNKIISDLYKSGIIQKKIKGMAYRNGIKPETYLHEDFTNDVFVQLCRHEPEFVISRHEENPKILIGLLVRIAVWKIFSTLKGPKGYPKRCIASYYLYASNYQSLTSLSTTDNGGDSDEGSNRFEIPALVDTSHEEDEEIELWKMIRSGLNKEDNEFLDWYLNHTKSKGRYTDITKNKIYDLMFQIEEIIERNKKQNL